MDKLNFISYLGATVFGGIIGYIMRTLVEHHLAIERNKENIKIIEFNKGASAFRAAFVDAIVHLQENINTGNKMVDHIIEPNVVITHEKAKILFEPFLSDSDLQDFNSVWENYRNYENDFFQKNKYFNPGKVSDRKDMSQYCLEQILRLLRYAKPNI